jgi:hypothetical protein
VINPNQFVRRAARVWDFQDEITADEGYVPHFPLGFVQSEYAEDFGMPLEAAQGYRETTYPEYMIKLKKWMSETATRNNK